MTNDTVPLQYSDSFFYP